MREREATPLRPRLEWREWPWESALSGKPLGSIEFVAAWDTPGLRPARVQEKIDGLRRKALDHGSPVHERLACGRILNALEAKYPTRRKLIISGPDMNGGWFEPGRGMRPDVYPSGASAVVHARGPIRFDLGPWGKEYRTQCGRGSLYSQYFMNERRFRVTCIDCIALAHKESLP